MMKQLTQYFQTHGYTSISCTSTQRNIVKCNFFYYTEYFEYFGPDFTLHPDVSTKMENQNTRQVSIYLSTCIYLSIYLHASIYLSIYLSVFLSIPLSIVS